MKSLLIGLVALAGFAALASQAWPGRNAPVKPVASKVGAIPGEEGSRVDYLKTAQEKGHDLAIFGAGCFWGVEAQFRGVGGVVATAVGFSGGHKDNVSYHQVCQGDTGHAEVVLVEFDPKKVTYEALVKRFFQIHDPTQVDRQGPDYGEQYRSAIFTFGDEQARISRHVMAELTKSNAYPKPIATEVTPATAFWKAEDYHQQYYEKKGYAPGTGICAVPDLG